MLAVSSWSRWQGPTWRRRRHARTGVEGAVEMMDDGGQWLLRGARVICHADERKWRGKVRTSGIYLPSATDTNEATLAHIEAMDVTSIVPIPSGS